MEGGPAGGSGGSPEASSPCMILKLKIVQQLHGWRAAHFQNGALAWAPRTFVLQICNRYTDGGRSFSKWGSRFGAAHIRLKSSHQLHGWGAGRFQNGALALAPQTFVLTVCNSYTDGGRPFSKWGSRLLGAAHIRLKSLQQLHGWRAGRFQNELSPGRRGHSF